MEKGTLVTMLQKQNPVFAEAVSRMIDYIQENGQHLIRPKNRQKRSMPTSIPSMRTVTEQ